MSGTVHVVHCIDTEGPLHESLEATFERLRSMFGLELDASATMLRRLQDGEVDLAGREAAVQRVVDPHLLAYNDTWDKIDLMLDDCMSTEFREQMRDSEGGGWVYNWFCVDHVDYDANPRRRDMGYHNIFDHYRRAVLEPESLKDGIHFHYHPHNFGRDAHRSATHWWASSDSLQQVISRRVIDREWFPTANRPGFHVIRPDSHWFLEQFVPFDYSSQAIVSDWGEDTQSPSSAGRWGDWRRAQATWDPYHPAHDDHQVPGACRRWIARCLNVGTRFRVLTESDVRQAFAEAREGKPVVLAFTNHDHRDIRPDVNAVRAMLSSVSTEFPDVPFRFSEAVDAMRSALQLSFAPPCDLDVRLASVEGGGDVLEVRTETPTFGPQPWLGIKTRSRSYHHDNFDVEIPNHEWRYVFDGDTFPLEAVEAIGVAANNSYGTATVRVLYPETGRVTKRLWGA